jgi:hypothetical protein
MGSRVMNERSEGNTAAIGLAFAALALLIMVLA